MDTTQLLLLIAVLLLATGILIVLTRTHAVAVLMGIELMFNAANINLIAFNRLYPDQSSGQLFVIFVLVIAAAEAALALAILLRIYRRYQTVHLDKIRNLREQ
ncbi:MAG: NADH-quinone oxidoreductase subunit NuoK [Bernardetiaceae bacterium]